MSKPSTHSFRPGVLQLESREVPAIASVRSLGGILTVQADNSATTVVVANTGTGISVQDVRTNRFWTFGYSQATRVDIIGGIGNDTFTARGNVRTRMLGNGGNDTFYGGTGRDIMFGGAGSDRMFGRNGSDYLDGGAGNDFLDGGNGDDVLLGGTGDDQLNGGLGADALSGDDGSDVLIAIDDTTADVVDGGGGYDIIWVDKNGAVTDLITGSSPTDTLNAVASFSNAGTDRTLNGDRITDPRLLPGDKYERFDNRSLFSSLGPTVEDFSQGQLGDCWFLAALGSTAMADPNIIRSRVVDFGDGTYGVRYESDTGSKFYRVDNDLAVKQYGDTFLNYTAFGLENSIWIAVMEKAYTHHRVPGANSFSSIEGGFSYDAFPHLGLSPERVWLDPNDPTLSDPIALAAYYQLITNTVRNIVDNGMAGTLGIDAVFFPGSQLITAHQYIVLGYEMDPLSGYLANITIRNPWGIDGPGSAATAASDSNFDDGILTITFDELINVQGSFEWAPVV